MDTGFAVQVPKANGAVVTLEKQNKSNTNHATEIPTYRNAIRICLLRKLIGSPYRLTE